MTLKQAIEEADRVRVPVRIDPSFTDYAQITKKMARVVASVYLDEEFTPGCGSLQIQHLYVRGSASAVATYEITPGTRMKILHLGR